jgi:hypothetical protein
MRFSPSSPKKLAGLRAALADARSDFGAKHYECLRTLHLDLGFESAAEFLFTYRAVNGFRNGRKLSPAAIRTLIARTAQGYTPLEIARELGVAKQTVANLRCRLGITAGRRVRSRGV